MCQHQKSQVHRRAAPAMTGFLTYRRKNNKAIITAAGSNTPTTQAKISNASLLIVGRRCVRCWALDLNQGTLRARMRDSAAAPSESLGMMHRPLTDNYLHALRAVARGEVFRTYNSQAFKLTGPCSSRLLWSLARMDLIADPPDGPLQGCHCMVLTAEGVAALRASGQDAGGPEIGVV
jgi:hypothetical protein